MKLRLLLFSQCNRSCPGCCNKDWDLGGLEVADSFAGYKEIFITGGEPMLRPDMIRECVEKIRQDNQTAPIYLYTAKPNPELVSLLQTHLDGVTLTLHEQSDTGPQFAQFYYAVQVLGLTETKSLRLNIFSEVEYPYRDFPLDGWKVKDGMEWIKDCPLPNDEVFQRYQ